MLNGFLNILIDGLPVAFILVLYFVRLEVRITKMSTDLCWVKKQLSRRSVDKRESGDSYAN